MLNTRIIASEVCSLTDARYFAAWDVDFLAFNCDPSHENYVGVAELKEIRDWVEGPRIAGSFPSNKDLNEQTLIKELDAVILDYDLIDHSKEYPVEVIPKVRIENVDDLVDLFLANDESTWILELKKDIIEKVFSLQVTEKNCYLDVDGLDLETIKKIVRHNTHGLVLKGSAEEKTGYKSFDFLDEAYDILMD